jgi:hypothetical protein
MNNVQRLQVSSRDLASDGASRKPRCVNGRLEEIVGGRHDQPLGPLRQTTADSPLLRFRAESSIFFHSVFIQFWEGSVEKVRVLWSLGLVAGGGFEPPTFGL